MINRLGKIQEKKLIGGRGLASMARGCYQGVVIQEFKL